MNLNLGLESSTWLAATASGGPVRRHLRMAQRALLLREGSLFPFRVGMRTASLSIGEKRLSKHLRLHHCPHPAVTTLLSARWFGIRLFPVNGPVSGPPVGLISESPAKLIFQTEDSPGFRFLLLFMVAQFYQPFYPFFHLQVYTFNCSPLKGLSILFCFVFSWIPSASMPLINIPTNTTLKDKRNHPETPSWLACPDQ